MIFSLFNHIGTISVSAEGINNIENGLILNKSVSGPDGNGVYTLTLEAYATGEKITKIINKDVPTDIVLVLDQSGSMDEDFTNKTTEYIKVYESDLKKNRTYYIISNNGHKEVTWCDYCKAWTYRCGWRFWEHISGTKYLPKTSSEDNANDRTQFYETREVPAVTKLEALKAAVSGFINSVYEKAKGEDGNLGTDDDVNHRIAVVGFAAGWKNDHGQHRYYKNTELFIGNNQYTYNAGSYNGSSNPNSAQSHYKEAFQSMNTTNGYNNVIASVNALDAEGGTITNLGLEMANGIFEKSSISSNENRNRVVIVFTDGVPGWSGYDSNIARAAIDEAYICKNSYNAKVYAVGIFAEADPKSAGNENGSESEKANWFMQNVSSNNGVVSSSSYYLAASDADGLNNVFQQISKEISEGGTTVTLDEDAVVKDIVSDYFSLPDNISTSDIKVYTSDYIDDNKFDTEEVFENAEIRIDISSKTVSVSNFSFKDNWVGKETAADGTVTYRGKKLIIKIPIVVRDGFLGGNKVPTNASGSGVYENASATKPVEEFDSPKVDVCIKDITITASDKNVYLYSSLTDVQLMQGVEIKCGNVVIDQKADNYGLESWQDAYVDISLITNADQYTSLTEDKKYSISCTVNPIYEGEATAKTNSKEGSINVFKPELTFGDRYVYYGDTASYGDANLLSKKWKHGETVDESVTMIGTAPSLTLEYEPEYGVTNGIVDSTDDILVDVTVKLNNGVDVGQYTTFVHEDCDDETWYYYNYGGKPAFMLHVKTCTLNVSKLGAQAIDENISFIFRVKGNNAQAPISMDVVIQGNGTTTIVGLPVGTYTITENENWSLRYKPENASYTVNLTSENPNNTANPLTISNTRNYDKWLDGNAYCSNVFNHHMNTDD